MSAQDKQQQGNALVKVKTVSAVVANGRTIYADGKKHRPGDNVELLITEAERFRRLGHIVDPDVAPLPTGSGPTFHAKDGPAIKIS
jgi:hypothetical protein